MQHIKEAEKTFGIVTKGAFFCKKFVTGKNGLIKEILMKKRLLGLILASVMTVSVASPAFADEKKDLLDSIATRQEELGWRIATIDDLSVKRVELQSQIEAMNGDMVDLMVQIGQAEDDIETTKQNIKTTNTKIKQAKKHLAAAEEKRDAQYEDMK